MGIFFNVEAAFRSITKLTPAEGVESDSCGGAITSSQRWGDIFIEGDASGFTPVAWVEIPDQGGMTVIFGSQGIHQVFADFHLGSALIVQDWYEEFSFIGLASLMG